VLATLRGQSTAMIVDKTILPYLSFDSKERFYFAYEDDCGNFRFESYYRPNDLKQGFEVHQLFCPNSIYRKPRSLKTLHTLHALPIDIDGVREPFPLSHWDILTIWRELGFNKQPTLIICTSPGHFHIILILKPLIAFPEKISYWERCQKGLCELLKDLGADYQPPTSFIRIPGHKNYKHSEKPLVERVFQSDSIFTLSEIYQVLIENGVIKKEKGNSPIEEKIQILLENGVPYGRRDRAAFTLAIYFNKYLGISQKEATDRLLEWNARLIEPLKPREIAKAVGSAYKGNYSLSPKWLNYLTETQAPTQTKQSYEILKQQKQPKRVSISTHAEKIRVHILSNGGALEISQRKLGKELDIPRRSFIEALKLIPNLHISSVGKGRNAKSILRLKQHNRLKLAQ
jgi:hypothetical protein